MLIHLLSFGIIPVVREDDNSYMAVRANYLGLRPMNYIFALMGTLLFIDSTSSSSSLNYLFMYFAKALFYTLLLLFFSWLLTVD